MVKEIKHNQDPFAHYNKNINQKWLATHVKVPIKNDQKAKNRTNVTSFRIQSIEFINKSSVATNQIQVRL